MLHFQYYSGGNDNSRNNSENIYLLLHDLMYLMINVLQLYLIHMIQQLAARFSFFQVNEVLTLKTFHLYPGFHQAGMFPYQTFFCTSTNLLQELCLLKSCRMLPLNNYVPYVCCSQALENPLQVRGQKVFLMPA